MKIHIVAAVLAAGATCSSLMATDAPDQRGRLPGAEIRSEGPSVGGPFAVTARAVSLGEVSVGGSFRLVGSTRVKAGSGLFSDGFESGDTFHWSTEVPEVPFPSRAVVGFELEECPPGWVAVNTFYRGRALVGMAPGGTRNQGVGSAGTGEYKSHYHYPHFTVTTDMRGHNHHWSTLWNASIDTWQSFSVTGEIVNMFTWENGIDAAGSGFYPFAATPGLDPDLFTQNSSHNHSFTFDGLLGTAVSNPLPKVLLLLCRKQ